MKIINKITSEIKKNWVGMIALFLVTSYMPIFMYSTNSNEVNFSEVLSPLGLFIGIVLIIFLVTILTTKSITKASLISCLLALVLENYGLCEKAIQSILPAAKYWHILPVLLFIILHICYVICVLLKEETRKLICSVLSLVIGVMIALNFATAIPNILEKTSIREENKGSIEVSGAKGNNDGANIYYFLLDEAAPFNVIEEVYDNDMSEFEENLREKGWMISETSYNSESIQTKVVLTNLINLDYLANDTMSDSELKQLRETNRLSLMVENNGYSLYGVGSTGWLGINSLTTDQQSSAETIDGKNFFEIIMEMSVLYPLFTKNYSDEQKIIMDSFDFFYGDIYDTSSEFKFTYINCPHQPFFFDENGNNNAAADYSNWEDEKYYLGQYKFVMKKLQGVLNQIISNDPNCIIIVGSDHGPRYNQEIPYEKKKNILQMVYYKGEYLEEIEGLSSINTLRSVLSKQFNIDLPIVEVP